jgi:hypothetical protein
LTEQLFQRVWQCEKLCVEARERVAPRRGGRRSFVVAVSIATAALSIAVVAVDAGGRRRGGAADDRRRRRRRARSVDKLALIAVARRRRRGASAADDVARHRERVGRRRYGRCRGAVRVGLDRFPRRRRFGRDDGRRHAVRKVPQNLWLLVERRQIGLKLLVARHQRVAVRLLKQRQLLSKADVGIHNRSSLHVSKWQGETTKQSHASVCVSIQLTKQNPQHQSVDFCVVVGSRTCCRNSIALFDEKL